MLVTQARTAGQFYFSTDRVKFFCRKFPSEDLSFQLAVSSPMVTLSYWQFYRGSPDTFTWSFIQFPALRSVSSFSNFTPLSDLEIHISSFDFCAHMNEFFLFFMTRLKVLYFHVIRSN